MLLLEATSAFAAGITPAQPTAARWLLDPQARCYVLHTDSHPANSVMWSGACADRRAEGPGTATFLLGGRLVQSISGNFIEGSAAGQGQIVWADGRHFEGTLIAGRPEDKTTAAGDSSQSAVSGAKPNGSDTATRTTVASADNKASANPLPVVAASVSPATVVASAVSQSPSVAVSVPVWLDGFKGQKLVAADGTAISIAASGGNLSLTTPPGSAIPSGYLTFLNGTQGTVSSDADGDDVRGLFRLMDAALIIDYAGGESAMLSRTPNGGLAIASPPASASTCSVWYPEGHFFSQAEREAAVAAYATKLGVVRVGFTAPVNCAGNAPLQADGTPQSKGSAPARVTRNHRGSVAKAAASVDMPEMSAVPVAVRASNIHLIDGAVSVPAPEALVAPAAETVAKIVAPATPSQCLSVEAEGADVGFRNHCGFEVQFAYCVVDAADPVRLCGTGAPAGGVPANGFGTLFAERNPKEMEHEFRWIACGGAHDEVLPKLVRTDPPAGQCVRARAT
jgi:hypothetical protein